MSREALLRLAFAGVHPDRLRRAVAGAGGPERLVRMVSRGGGDLPDVAKVEVARSALERAAELALLSINVVQPGDPGYPARLTKYEDAPPNLFVRGAVPSGPSVAVVGTRKCTAYGRDVAHAYGVAIARAGWTLVSGLARGIDGAAHTGTVAVGGRGVGVLGCGSDVRYPRTTHHLQQGLLGYGGAIVTEYPPGVRPEAWRFPPRNRIIAGLADAVVVIEAAERGGALITALRAAEYGVPVFAVPGDIDREASRGCNLLIRDGAHPVLDPADLIEELALVDAAAGARG